MKRRTFWMTMTLMGVLTFFLSASEVDQLKSDLVGQIMGGREKCWKFQSIDQIKELVIKNKTEDAQKRVYIRQSGRVMENQAGGAVVAQESGLAPGAGSACPGLEQCGRAGCPSQARALPVERLALAQNTDKPNRPRYGLSARLRDRHTALDA